eukprot:Rhum_TRINITY_DN14798_c23_g1::Rhum_TRINITY_DN14798_c23_g1_i1::g.111087::m.111087
MSNFTSASEMARAKRMHKCDLAIGGVSSPPPAAAAAAPAAETSVARSQYSERRSHTGFAFDKKRHLAEVQHSPPRARPASAGARDLEGPPYHTSCRDLGHEKVEHLTPLYPAAGRSANGAAAAPDQLTSNEEMSCEIRRHNHEMDSVQRSTRRAHEDAAAAAAAADADGECGAAAASPVCQSAQKFSALKAGHRHGIDECQEHKHAQAAEEGVCTSSEALRKKKACHKHAIDDCRPDRAEEEAEAPLEFRDGKWVSVARMSREIKAHKCQLDSWSPRKVKAELEVGATAYSNRAWAKKKANHDIDQERLDEIKVRNQVEEANSEQPNRSNAALAASKKRHRKTIGANGGNGSMSRFNSNGEYGTVKRKHRHTTDVYPGYEASQAGSIARSHFSRRSDDGQAGQCVSVQRMQAGKKNHSYKIDGHKPAPEPQDPAAAAAAEVAARCSSNARFTDSKKHHRHELDECVAAKAAPKASNDNLYYTSNFEVSQVKKNHKMHMTAGRSPRREIFESNKPPVIAPSLSTPRTPVVEA